LDVIEPHSWDFKITPKRRKIHQKFREILESIKAEKKYDADGESESE